MQKIDHAGQQHEALKRHVAPAQANAIAARVCVVVVVVVVVVVAVNVNFLLLFRLPMISIEQLVAK
jgi:hypothetical protein